MSHAADPPARSLLPEPPAAGEPGDQRPRQGRRAVLPENLPPRGVSRAEAAAYLGISPTLFDELVKDGRMPPAKKINGRRVWDRRKLDIAFDAIPDGDGAADDPWGRVSV